MHLSKGSLGGKRNVLCSLSFAFFCSDPKLCAIPMTPNGHLDPSLPCLNQPGAAAGIPNPSRNSLQPDQVLMALESRKSSVMSLVGEFKSRCSTYCLKPTYHNDFQS